MTKLAEAPAVKFEGGNGFKARDYFYTPDTAKPSTWKLRRTNTPGGNDDKGLIGAAAAALGPGFRGQKVVIPAAALSGVKSKVRAAWKKLNPDKDDATMPKGIKESALDEALSHSELDDQLCALLRAQRPDDDDWWPYVDDVNENEGWFAWRLKGQYFQQDYSVDENDVVTVTSEPREVLRSTSYRPKPTGVPTPAPTPAPAAEAKDDLDGDWIALVENSVRRDGTVPVKVIEPGWGTSGYYSAEVLERDGAAAFPSGTQMYWDHPTAAEEAERPERSLRDLAAVTVGDARWDAEGPAGAAVYADAKVFGDYTESIEDLAPHIGVSIRALGSRTMGEADGQSGQIIEQIAQGKSIDFVTAPGAGGEIVQLFEAARPGATRPEPREEPTVADNDKLTEVQRELDSTKTKLTEAETERDQLKERADQGARDREQLVLREARDYVVAELAKPEVKLPEITKARLAESVSTTPPMTDEHELDKKALDTRLSEAVKGEIEYLAKLTGNGQVIGLGESNGDTDPKVDEALNDRLEESFKGLGLSDDAAKVAAAGRS